MANSVSLDREPNKRSIKPPTNPEFLNLESIFGESSSDSDFCIGDHCINSGSDSDETLSFTNTDDESSSHEEFKNDNEDEIGFNDNVTPGAISAVTNGQDGSDKVDLKRILDSIHICSICLDNDVNKLINCDGCGISVHNDCYGVPNSGVSSSVYSCYVVLPWFCETCKAGIENPSCELCPNFGGIYKETDNGKWVHLVCALYFPGAEFGEVTSLSKIKLFANTSPQWGNNKHCTMCKDIRFMCTGVTIACDAGMCRSNFHVTCAQREGCLSDATSQETDQTDPFYAHCKSHVDKLVAKKRQKNWQALQLRTKKLQLLQKLSASEKSATWQCNNKILKQFQSKYHQMIQTNKPDSMLKSKIPRPITTSASACRALRLKAELMGVDVASQEAIEGQIKTLRDISKKWHIPPEFSVEFTMYVSDRNLRSIDLKNQLKHSTDQKNMLREEQIKIQEKYIKVLNDNENIKKKHSDIKQIITAYHNILFKVGNTNAKVPDIDEIIKGGTPSTSKECIGSSVKYTKTSGIIDNDTPLNLNNKCGICSRANDQHLLAKCDTCYLYYHIGCLNPPLTRLPKKTKLFGWQCSECDNSSSNSELETVDINAPRKLRYGAKERSVLDSQGSSIVNNDLNSFIEQNKLLTKNKKQKQPRKIYYPKVIIKRPKPLKRKQNHHKANITSKVEPTSDLVNEPSRQGTKLLVDSVRSKQLLITSQADEELQTSMKPNTEKSVALPKITSTGVKITQCSICKTTGTSLTMVQCAECSENYHFSCLDPPLKKSPIVHGYSWNCAECDATESDAS